MNSRTNRKRTAVLAAAFVAAVATVLTVAEGPARAAFPGSTGAIAFVTTRDGGNDIYRMNGDGFGQTRLTETPGMNQDPAWSADGERIVFGNRNWDDIYGMKADGSDERNLTNADGLDFAASYYPAGDRVAFSTFRGERFQTDVYTMNLSSNGQVTGLTRITTDENADDQAPVVSPDGKRMSFASDRAGGDFDIYVMKAAPEGPKNVPVRITRSPANDYAPEWSPDGTRLAFERGQAPSHEVMTIKAAPEGKTNRAVNLSKSTADDGSPTWSPDGKKVAFRSNRAAPDGTTDYEIWRVRASDGANPKNLTNAPGNDTDPAWQPLP